MSVAQHPAPLEARRVEWERVARAVYAVRVHYRYTYTGPVTELKQRLMVVPRDCHGDQRLLDERLEVRGSDGSPVVRGERDAFGNRVCRILVPRIVQAVDFEVWYRVERVSGRSLDGPLSAMQLRAHLQSTALTAPDPRLRATAAEIAARAADPRERAERAFEWAAGAIGYQFGVTGYRTPAAMALHLGRGVCQDYAHILLCVLRLLDVPARYVSGHLLGEGAPHAWVEALLSNPAAPNGLDVIPYDPTHRRRAGMSYLTVAIGRDYADVSPTCGTFSGPGIGKLSYTKQAEAVEVQYDGAPSAARGKQEPAA